MNRTSCRVISTLCARMSSAGGAATLSAHSPPGQPNEEPPPPPQPQQQEEWEGAGALSDQDVPIAKRSKQGGLGPGRAKGAGRGLPDAAKHSKEGSSARGSGVAAGGRGQDAGGGGGGSQSSKGGEPHTLEDLPLAQRISVLQAQRGQSGGQPLVAAKHRKAAPALHGRGEGGGGGGCAQAGSVGDGCGRGEGGGSVRQGGESLGGTELLSVQGKALGSSVSGLTRPRSSGGAWSMQAATHLAAGGQVGLTTSCRLRQPKVVVRACLWSLLLRSLGHLPRSQLPLYALAFACQPAPLMKEALPNPKFIIICLSLQTLHL